MNINFSGYNENVVSFAVDENSEVTMGTPVKMVSSATVGACDDGDIIAGVAVNVRNGYAAVQLSGYIEMPADTMLPIGYQKLVATTSNKVKCDDNGREYLVVYSAGGVVGFIL